MSTSITCSQITCRNMLQYDNTAKIMPGWDIPGEPGSQVPTKSSGSHEMFAEIHAFYRKVFSVKWSKKFLSNKCFPAERRDFLVQKYYHKQILSSRRNVLPQNEISYHSKKFLATRRCFVISRNFLSQKEISCHRKRKFTLQ